MNNKDIKAPIAKTIPFEINYHGEVYKDEYAWLKEKTNPEVISYLEEENKHLETLMAHTKELQENLYKEMVGRIQETDMNVPEKLGEYYYYSRTEEGKQYRIHCRKKENSNEEILLDLNEIGKGFDYISLGAYRVSQDNNYLAYSIDTDGSESYTLKIKDLKTGQHLKDEIKDSSSVEWTNDNKTILYSVLDEAKRPYKAFRHNLGEELVEDELIYHEPDEAFYVNISKTNDLKYFLVTMVSQTTSEVYYMKADSSDNHLKLVTPRVKDTEYYLEHYNDIFYIITNYQNSHNFKVMTVNESNPQKADWKDFIPHREDVRVEYIHVLKDFLIIYERSNGLKHIRVKSNHTSNDYYIEFPEPVYTFHAGKNRDYESHILRYHYTSLVNPESVYDFDLKNKKAELKKRYDVLGGYNPENYVSERVFATSHDGTQVPISIMYKKGTILDGSNPLYLYGYGSYEICIEPNFSSNRLSLIDRGFIFAMAHIRGGGEMGREWYENGKFLKKKNTFKDFIACAEHLINNKYTSKDKLVIMGGSAGGLLMGAVTNMRPDLFKVVVSHVPFVDVINTMMDASLPLTVIEYDEWGNPNNKEYFDYMKSYSPYDNIQQTDYPNMFVAGGLNDPRVGYWEPAKLVARLRTMKTDNNILVLKTNMGAGHGGASGRYDHLKEIAEEYAFILDIFDIKK
ncbi:MAG: S9 family peptidase [Candidatus Sericytochromatia bacterium]